MLEEATMQEALGFSVASLLLALVIVRVRPEFRRAVAFTLLAIMLGLGGLVVLSHFNLIPSGLSISIIPRELCLLVIAIGNIRIWIMFVVQVLLGRKAVPRILGDVAIAVALVVFALVRMNSVGVNLASIITTSAVLTGVVAFSLQATLGNLWGGIALQLDNTCRIGDWIQIEGVMGQVVGIRWRYTAIATNRNETIIIPNGQLVNNRVTLLGRRGDDKIPTRRHVEFEVGYEWTPGQVIDVVNAALDRAEIPWVATEPKAHCICWAFDAPAIKYVVRYWLMELREDEWVDSNVRVHIFAALGRARMEIPISRSDLYLHSARHLATTKNVREQQSRLEMLGSLALFATLTEKERESLAEWLKPVPFAPGEAVIRQGEAAESLFVLARGTLDIYNEPQGEMRQRLASVLAPAYVGEMGLLTGQPRRATVIAAGEVLCYRLDKTDFEAILSARPQIVEAMSHTIAEREAANNATLAALTADARSRATKTRAGDIMQRIREFFNLT